MQDRKDRVAVVTGAAGDIGRAIAAALSESHAKVVLVDIDPDALSMRFPAFRFRLRFENLRRHRSAGSCKAGLGGWGAG